MNAKLEFNNEGVAEITRGDLILRIVLDTYMLDPREDDNLGVMVCFHKRYKLGDNNDIDFHDFECWNEMEAYIEGKLNAKYILPLYLLDHSILAISTTSFNDRWDSGHVGFVYVTEKRINEWYGKDVDKEMVLQQLRNEVDIYNHYLRGEGYGYIVVKLITCPTCFHFKEETVGSCFGFYSPGDALEHVVQQYPEFKMEVKNRADIGITEE